MEGGRKGQRKGGREGGREGGRGRGRDSEYNHPQTFMTHNLYNMSPSPMV